MNRIQYARMLRAIDDVGDERARQHQARGEQTLPHVLGDAEAEMLATRLLHRVRALSAAGDTSWPAVMLEEACEAALATPEERAAEVTQASAVGVQWREALLREEDDAKFRRKRKVRP